MRGVHRTAVCVALVGLFCVGCRDEVPVAPAAGPAPAADLTADHSSRHIVVLRNQAELPEQVLAAIAAGGGQIARRQAAIGVLSVSGLSDAGVAALARDTSVTAIGRDRLVRWLPPLAALAAAEPGDVTALSNQSTAYFFLTGWQWNISQIGANAAWLVSPQGAGALVCILDTGVDPGHLDLSGRVDLATSASFIAAEPDIYDRHFHGTFVAALVASRGIWMASVAPDARLCAVKVLDQNGEGTIDDVVAGIMYAAGVHADVINMSLGATLPAKDPDTRALSLALQRAVLFAVDQGALVVAGAGNDGLDLDRSDQVVIPAELPGVLAVGATAPLGEANFDRLASYTNYGRTSVDLMAPGGEDLNTMSTKPRDAILSACSSYAAVCGVYRYAVGWGTSFAAPHVAGAAAVLESAIPGDQSGSDLAACLYRGADHPDGKNLSPRYSRGRVNVLRALQLEGCGG